MKKATKLTAAVLAATLSLSLAACGSSASTGTASTSASADGVVYRTLDEIKADGTAFSRTRTRSAFCRCRNTKTEDIAQRVGERTSPLPKTFRTVAKFNPSGSSSHLPC